MTQYEFINIPKSQQIEVVRRKGVHLASRVEGKQKFEIYSVDRFYVEVLVDERQMAIVRSFKTFTRLAPYLDNISLAKLLT